MQFATALRTLKKGWTPALLHDYFTWIAKAAQFKGGNSIRGFMANIRRDALANLSDSDKAAREADSRRRSKTVIARAGHRRCAAVRQGMEDRRAGDGH